MLGIAIAATMPATASSTGPTIRQAIRPITQPGIPLRGAGAPVAGGMPLTGCDAGSPTEGMPLTPPNGDGDAAPPPTGGGAAAPARARPQLLQLASWGRAGKPQFAQNRLW